MIPPSARTALSRTPPPCPVQDGGAARHTRFPRASERRGAHPSPTTRISPPAILLHVSLANHQHNTAPTKVSGKREVARHHQDSVASSSSRKVQVAIDYGDLRIRRGSQLPCRKPADGSGQYVVGNVVEVLHQVLQGSHRLLVRREAPGNVS